MPLLGDALLVLGALALFGERLVDRILALVWPDVEAGEDPSGVYVRIRGIVGIGMVFGFGMLVAFGLNLNLMGQIFKDVAISDVGGKWLTALLIGGGAAPAHEVVRYVENKKAKAKEEKAHAEVETKEKRKRAQA